MVYSIYSKSFSTVFYSPWTIVIPICFLLIESPPKLKYMRSLFLTILVVPLLCFCQSTRPVQADSFADLKIGKSQTGVKANISAVQQVGLDWQFDLIVEKSKQGGASSPIIPVGRTVKAQIAELTLRKLDKLRSTTLSSDLAKAKMCLAVLGSRNKQTEVYEIYDLILLDN